MPPSTTEQCFVVFVLCKPVFNQPRPRLGVPSFPQHAYFHTSSFINHPSLLTSFNHDAKQLNWHWKQCYCIQDFLIKCWCWPASTISFCSYYHISLHKPFAFVFLQSWERRNRLLLGCGCHGAATHDLRVWRPECSLTFWYVPGLGALFKTQHHLGYLRKLDCYQGAVVELTTAPAWHGVCPTCKCLFS